MSDILNKLVPSNKLMFEELKNLSFTDILNNLLIPYASKLLLALAIYFIGKYFAKIISKQIAKIVYKSSKDEMLKHFTNSVCYIFLLIIIIIASLSQIGVDTSSFVAIIAAAGLAIGLALKNSLQNFAGGIMILLTKPFKKGDFIEVSSISGTVEKIGVLMLELRTPDNKTIFAPNSEIFDNPIINYSINPIRRINFVFDISYDANLQQAKQIIESCFEKNKNILPKPNPVIALGEMGESSIRIYARPWVKTENYWNVYFMINEDIKTSFDAANIEIPFKKLDVNITSLDSEKVQL